MQHIYHIIASFYISMKLKTQDQHCKMCEMVFIHGFWSPSIHWKHRFYCNTGRTMYRVLPVHDRGVIGYHPTHCCQILNQYSKSNSKPYFKSWCSSLFLAWIMHVKLLKKLEFQVKQNSHLNMFWRGSPKYDSCEVWSKFSE